jgi:hypothetical protein
MKQDKYIGLADIFLNFSFVIGETCGAFLQVHCRNFCVESTGASLSTVCKDMLDFVHRTCFSVNLEDKEMFLFEAQRQSSIRSKPQQQQLEDQTHVLLNITCHSR